MLLITFNMAIFATIFVTDAYVSWKFLNYYPFRLYPYEITMKISGESVTSVFPQKKSLVCTAFDDPDPLPVRLMIVNYTEIRIFGKSNYEVLFCLDSSISWIPDLDCDYQNDIMVNDMPVLTMNESLMIQCEYEMDIYTSEFFIDGHVPARMVNYPPWLEDTDILLVYHPLAMISCGLSDNTETNWLDLDTMIESPNPFVTNKSLPMKCNDFYELTNKSITCRIQETDLYNLTFSILHCFDVSIRSHQCSNENRIFFEAGENVTCAITPKLTGKFYFNPIHPPVMTMSKDNVTLNETKFIFEIPEKIKECLTCEFLCGFSNETDTYIIPDFRYAFQILTNYKTYLEIRNRKWFSFVPFMFFDEEFRCADKSYGWKVITTAVQIDEGERPFSVLALYSDNMRMSSKRDKWIKVKRKYYNKTGANKWMIYCTLYRAGITTPIHLTFLAHDDRFVDIKLIYPYPRISDPVLEGYIYKCFRKDVFHDFYCLYGCEVVEIKHFFPEEYSVAIIKEITEEIVFSLRCIGFRTYTDPDPLVKEVTLYAIPSVLFEMPTHVFMDTELFSYRYYFINDTRRIVFYDSKVTLIKDDVIVKEIQTDLKNDSMYITIPIEGLEETHIFFCSINTVNDSGHLDCDKTSMKRLHMIKVTYTPSLLENTTNILQSGTIVYCSICVSFMFNESNIICNDNNKLVLSTERPFRKRYLKRSTRIMKLPDIDSVNYNETLEDWDFQLTCYLGTTNISWRYIKLKTCTELVFLPKEKEIFHWNETIECSIFPEKCRYNYFYHITVFKENVLFLDVPQGLGVRLDREFVGDNSVTCSLFYNDSLFIERNVHVMGPPFNIYIVNNRSILLVGDTMGCEGEAYPYPSKTWDKVEGEYNLHTMDNYIVILPSDVSGDYAYDCIIENLHGCLSKRVHFYVHNRFKTVYMHNADNFYFYIIISSISFGFVILFEICRRRPFKIRFGRPQKITRLV